MEINLKLQQQKKLNIDNTLGIQIYDKRFKNNNILNRNGNRVFDNPYEKLHYL